MKALLIMATAASLLVGTARTKAAEALVPQTFKQKITKKVESSYLLYLPKDYAADKKKQWPLMLFLHGAGERGTDLNLVAKHGPPKLIKAGQDFPFIVVSPQCPDDQRWDDETLLALLDNLAKKYRVDSKRIYLTGLSMGGYGTWSLAIKHPERFAAVAPICGGGDLIDVLLSSKLHTAELKRLPIWVFHGAKDPVVPLAESERMIAGLKKAGVKNVKLTVYPEAQHDSWTETYANPALYDWLLQQSLP